MTALDHTFAVILAGGGGTRLWPKSREATPKQFLKLSGHTTMMQVAADRVHQLVPWDRMIVVTNIKYIDEVKAQLPEIPAQNIILEPQKRDTAMAMLAGALFAKTLDPQAIVINGASDHVVEDQKEFVRVMTAAVEVAAKETDLIAVGITPTFPSSAFGYIKVGNDLKKLDKGLSLFKVDSFTEKPNASTARAFISTGKYFWNANMYVWSVKALESAFALHMPTMHEQTKHLGELSPKDFHAALPAVYDQVEAISVDYAISEKADNLVLIPGDFGWNDVGDWKVVYELGTKDPHDNVIMGEGENHVVALQSEKNLIHTNGRMIALVGVSDMIVVDTDEIVMILPKDRSQDVKKIVEQLKAGEMKEYL